MAQKDALVATLRQEKYVDVIAQYPNVTLRRGRGLINRDLSITIDGDDLKAERLIVTTGASPWVPPIPGLAETGDLTSTEALALTALPASIIVIGGSAVGLEIAQLYARLGSRVTVLEAMPTLIPLEDFEIGTALAEYLREEEIEVHVGASIGRASRDGGRYAVSATIQGRSEEFAAGQPLVATGRRANTRGFGLEDAGVELGDKDQIHVNQYLETSRAHLFAAGDVVGDPMFVYVAAYAGNIAVENAINGNSRQYDLAALPRVTFTDPQVAAVGMTEAEARAKGVDVAVSKLPLSYVPRALAARETRGFIKLVADRRTRRLVGAHVLATEAGDMIQEAALAIKYSISVANLAAAFHPYLTLAEGIKLAHRPSRRMSRNSSAVRREADKRKDHQKCHVQSKSSAPAAQCAMTRSTL